MTRCLFAVCLSMLTLSPLQAQDDQKKGDDAAKTKAATEKKSDDKPAEIKTRVLKIENKDRAGKVTSTLPLTIPVTWKEKPSASRMRAATLEIPVVGTDKEKGELAVFLLRSQSIDDNIGRWVKQFQSTGRKKKIMKGQTAKKQDYYLVEVSGTYKKPDGPPRLQRTKDTAGFRMLAAILPIKGQGMYFIKLTGPDKTVAAQAKAMRKAIGGDLKTEKAYVVK